jgi:signal peptidase I
MKKRKPFLAAILSLLFPGVGQIYNGQLRKAIIFIFISLFLPSLLYFTGLQYSFYGLVFIGIISVGFFYFYVVIDAVLVSRQVKETVLKPYNRWFIYIAFAVVSLLISEFNTSEFIGYAVRGIKAFKNPTSGMEQTMLVGDHFYVNLKAYKDKLPANGDVIVFRYPEDTTKNFIKRVMAAEGDTIEIQNKKVIVNGKAIDDTHASFQDKKIIPALEQPRDNMKAVKVPAGTIFVLGDNRDMSSDSRHWGFLEKKHIIGKVLYVYWSWDKKAGEIRWDRIGHVIR